MERRQIGLKLVMDRLGQPMKVETFEDRLILQKTVYLAQAAGVQLGYFFRWYLRGPYCPDVADDGFAIAVDASANIDDSRSWNLDAVSCQRLALMAPFLNATDRATLAKELELLASVHYLVDRKQVPDSSAITITTKLHACGKSFNQVEVERAIGELRAHGMLS